MTFFGRFLVMMSEKTAGFLAIACLLFLCFIARRKIIREEYSLMTLTVNSLIWPFNLLVLLSIGLCVIYLIGALSGYDFPWYANPMPARVALWSGMFLTMMLLTGFLLRRWLNPIALFMSNWIWWALTSLSLYFTVPGVTIVFLLPTLVVTLSLLVYLQKSFFVQSNEFYTIVAISIGASSLVWLPLIAQIEEAMGLGVNPAVLLPIVIFIGLLLPIFVRQLGCYGTKVRSCIGGVLSLVFVCSFLISINQTGYSDERPQRLNIHYLEDSDKKEAYWRLSTKRDYIPQPLSDQGGFVRTSIELPWEQKPHERYVSESSYTGMGASNIELLTTVTLGELSTATLRLIPDEETDIQVIYIPVSAQLVELKVNNELVNDLGRPKDNYYEVRIYTQDKMNVLIKLSFKQTKETELLVKKLSWRLPKEGRELIGLRTRKAVPYGMGDVTEVLSRLKIEL